MLWGKYSKGRKGDKSDRGLNRKSYNTLRQHEAPSVANVLDMGVDDTDLRIENTQLDLSFVWSLGYVNRKPQWMPAHSKPYNAS